MRSEFAALALLATLGRVGLPAQSPELAGTVVDATTGQAIPGARVRLRAGTADPLFATAGPDGRFEFTGLTAQRYSLIAWHPGYITAAEAANAAEATAMAPDGDVRLGLVPYGAIAGTVTDYLGVPVQGATVDALQRYPIGERHPGSSPILDGPYQYVGRLIFPTTDDRGHFRLAPLPPGEYYVIVQPTSRFGGVALPLDPKQRATFYPHALKISDAQPVQVQAGKTTPVDLQILHQSGITISGRVLNLSPSGLVSIGARPRSNLAGSYSTLDPISGDRFTLDDVLPGTYDIQAAQFAATDTNHQTPLTAARRTLEVAGQPIDGIELTLRSTIDLPVTITYDSGCDPSPLQIQVQSDSRFLAVRNFHFAAGATVVFDHLAPGTYHAYPRAEAPSRAYVSSTEFGGADVRATGFEVTPDTKGPLQIQMSCRR